MEFHTYGDRNAPSLMLLPGLGVSYEIFLPLVGLLQNDFHIIAVEADGFVIGKYTRFTSVDDQAAQANEYVMKHLGGRMDCAYGLSMGGKILSRMLERDEISIGHAVLDAAPLLPLPRWLVGPLRYFQCMNVWTCCHWTGFWKRLFNSHYFDVLLDECRKVWPYGGGQAVLDGYRDIYTNKLESIPGAGQTFNPYQTCNCSPGQTINPDQAGNCSPDPTCNPCQTVNPGHDAIKGTDIHFWYGTKEAFVAKPQARHLQSLCPEAHVEVFNGMNHGQLLIDNPAEIASRIKRFCRTANKE